MIYGVIKVSNGAFAIEAEWSDLDKAKAQYHKACQIHWSAPNVEKATIMLCDENLNPIRGFKETITHEVKPKCYVDFNPKDYNLGGKKGCLGELDYTKKDADGHCELETKCVDCKYRRKESSTM